MKWTSSLWRQIAAMKSPLQVTEKEVSIKAPWGNIAALSWGDPSNPPVLLCHGKLDACSGFRPLVFRLPPCFFYLSIDLPGNGRSDHMPKGIRYSVLDLVPTISKVVQHFKWEKFMYIGHSLGVPIGKFFDIAYPGYITRSVELDPDETLEKDIGKFFDIAYPGYITRSVELDPVPGHLTWPSTREGIHNWYHSFYNMYDDENYPKICGDADTAPKYTYDKAQELMMHARGISKEATEHVLERCLEPAGDGLYRLPSDQRMKMVTILPFSPEALKQIYTSTKVPTFCVLSKRMLKLGFYEYVPFVTDEKCWPNNNYKYKIVDGGHDVHLDDPDSMADDIGKFLLAGVKGKL